MKTKPLIALLALGTLLLSVGLGGCKKEPEAAPTETVQTEVQAPVAAAQDIEQTTCPVMGNAIDKEFFVEYQGKKVYFCCEKCKKKFSEAPEKYVAKLPQFKQLTKPE